MSDLTRHLRDYLKVRRTLGFKLVYPGMVLPRLVAYVEAAGADTLTVDLMVSWAQQRSDVQPIKWAQRLSAARGFATYLKALDARAEIPPPDVFGARQRRPTPYLWASADVERLLTAAKPLNPALRAETFVAMLGTLAVTGMRISEALALNRADVDLSAGILTIWESKFGQSRWVPLHETATAALAAYAATRDRLCPAPESAAFFLSQTGRRLTAGTARRSFKEITTDLGLRSGTTRPRIHDLRHTFAVRTLTMWMRTGADVEGNMPKLSTYLGHVSPSSTYWYLSASPELMALAAARLEGGQGSPS